MALFSSWSAMGALNSATKGNATWTPNPEPANKGKIITTRINGNYADCYLKVFREAATEAKLDPEQIVFGAENPLSDASRRPEIRGTAINIPHSFIEGDSRFTAELAHRNSELTTIREQAYADPKNVLGVLYGRPRSDDQSACL